METSAEKFYKKGQTPSSRIKASIVAKYFPKYCKILNKGKKQKEIRYIDLFSGPGIYKDGNPTTPILLAQACAEDSILRDTVHLMFNDNEFIDELKENFNNHFSQIIFKFKPKFGSKTVGSDKKIDEYLNRQCSTPNVKPTLLFVDPFGYKDINTLALANFLKGWGNEIFLFLNTKRIQPALDNEKFEQLMVALFPTTIERLKKDRRYTANTQDRLYLIVENIGKEFENIVKPPLYCCPFKFIEEDSKGTSHFLVHLTKHSRGFDLVKQIYNEFENIGASLISDTYTFDSKSLDVPDDSTFDFGDENLGRLSKLLISDCGGKEINAKELYDNHHVNTNFAPYHYVKALRKLVEEKKVIATFTDDIDHKVSVVLTNSCNLKFL